MTAHDVRGEASGRIIVTGPDAGPVEIDYAETWHHLPDGLGGPGKRQLGSRVWAVPRHQALSLARFLFWRFRDRHQAGNAFRVSLEEDGRAYLEGLARLGERQENATQEPRGKGGPPRGEHLAIKFPPGTVWRIESALAPGENRTAFLRAAVEAELQRRGF